jgi:hypothetical protein
MFDCFDFQKIGLFHHIMNGDPKFKLTPNSDSWKKFGQIIVLSTTLFNGCPVVAYRLFPLGFPP